MTGVYIDHGVNDILYAEDGRAFIDLHTGFGTVLLGHANTNIVSALNKQVNKTWTTGRRASKVVEDAQEIVQRFLPSGLLLAGFGSTGLEAAEFALRIACAATGRSSFVGFSHSMHGKSVATIALCWPNSFGNLPGFHRLSFLPETREQDALVRLEEVLRTESVAAVFVEPILASNGGYAASTTFHREVVALCGRFGALSIYDEILTGFFRTGHRFCIDHHGVIPDILLLGKAIGNGFPVSVVALHERFSVLPAMLAGSTFSGNPLAAAVVGATLREMSGLDMPARMNAIEAAVRESLAELEDLGAVLRGTGGLWILELPSKGAGPMLAEQILKNGVLVSASGGFLRILPPATITPDNLARACNVIKGVCVDMLGTRQA